TVSIDLTADFTTTTAGGPLNGLNALQIDTQPNAQTAVTNLPAVQQSFNTSSTTLTSRSAALSGLASYVAQARIESVAAQTGFVGIDIAEETTHLVRDQLLLTSGAAALQVANFAASSIVNLLTAVANRAASG